MTIERTLESEHYKITVRVESRETPAHAVLTDHVEDVRYFAGAVSRDLSDRIERMYREQQTSTVRPAAEVPAISRYGAPPPGQG